MGKVVNIDSHKPPNRYMTRTEFFQAIGLTALCTGTIGAIGGIVYSEDKTLNALHSDSQIQTKACTEFYELIEKGKTISEADNIVDKKYQNIATDYGSIEAPVFHLFASLTTQPELRARIFRPERHNLLFIDTMEYGVIAFRLSPNSANIAADLKNQKNYAGNMGYEKAIISHRVAMNVPEVKTFLASCKSAEIE